MEPKTQTQPGIVIIGTGFAGLCMGIRLKQSGIDDFVMLERSDEVGGVWRDNTYPGAACDVPSHLYSFSFAPKHDWSRRYPPQPELLEYQRQCAKDFGLYPHIRFNSEVARAHFDESSQRWTVTTQNGATLEARVLISGVGQLSRPAWPKIAGREQFQGVEMHSAEWDPAVELDGKRIAVVGTGASAIQFIPEVAEKAGRLFVYQRTPPYVIPKPNNEYSGIALAALRYLPWLRGFYRWMIYRVLGEGTINAFNEPNSRIARLFRWIARRNLRKNVPDPVLREKLTPNYPMGCKRVLFASNYYPALSRPNVEVLTERVEGLSASGVQAGADSRDIDVLIWGTGFAATDFLAPMAITGRGGLTLTEAWKDGAEAYLGMTVSGFPNFFMLYGPNTNLGNNSIIFMIECQANYILQAIKLLRAGDRAELDVRADVQRQFNSQLQEELRGTVWSAGCSSWYHTADGKVTNNWPGPTRNYAKLTETFQLEDFKAA